MNDVNSGFLDDTMSACFERALDGIDNEQVDAIPHATMKKAIFDAFDEAGVFASLIPPFIVARAIMVCETVGTVEYSTGTSVTVQDEKGRWKHDDNFIRRCAYDFNALLTPDEMTSVFNYLRAYATKNDK